MVQWNDFDNQFEYDLKKSKNLYRIDNIFNINKYYSCEIFPVFFYMRNY